MVPAFWHPLCHVQPLRYCHCRRNKCCKLLIHLCISSSGAKLPAEDPDTAGTHIRRAMHVFHVCRPLPLSGMSGSSSARAVADRTLDAASVSVLLQETLGFRCRRTHCGARTTH